MDYGNYYHARSIVKEIIKKDLLGPVEANEEIKEYPVSYYLIGKLYPQDCRFEQEHSSSEDIGDTEEENLVSLDDGRVPSSMGITFSLTSRAQQFSFSVKAARFNLLDETDPETKKRIWKRYPLQLIEQIVDVPVLCSKKKLEYVIDEGLSIIVLLHNEYSDGSKTVTATLINTYRQGAKESRLWVNQHTFFQPEIEIVGEKSSFTDIRRKIRINSNKDVQEMEMLYSKCRNYVTGHGCAADFSVDGEKIKLYTMMLPEYELTQMMPAQNYTGKALSMLYLAHAEHDQLLYELNRWIDDYKKWIDKKSEEATSLDAEYKECADDNLKKCLSTYETIKKSIKCLQEDTVYKSFAYANEAMFLQRKHTLQNAGIVVNENEIKWYPFQLAFILQEIVSFADPYSSERKKVDLLWFPTGGGKTEAYLGIAAFVIFLRRMRNPRNGSGVSIIMRYTMRLLTFQQFERASTMICACEKLRKKYNIPGGEISIGLWAGKALTPNTIEVAEKILNGYKDPDNESSNPRQIKKCPWCGKPIEQDNYLIRKNEKRMYIRCGNPKCDFKNGLPIYLIDEEIYHYRPSFLVATVDKFAQVVQNENTFAIFGKHSNNKPPELIIQDELHLISGPLGTITGIYEAAFKKLCTSDGINAKVIASTATIRNAKEQIHALYGADFTQFPPQGIEADDSYFAVKSTASEKPSRLYMGCMGTGTSATTVMIRVMAVTLFATRYLETLGFDEKIIDSFWTITSYFNTLRELGGAIVRVVDNVQDRFSYLKETKFKDIYPIIGGQKRYDNYIELTSREKSENIGKIIQEDLLIKYSKDKKAMPYDFILSSNMISVGIDISRLNVMLVVGQPKTTAEYIQATSRVGRETPGLVFTMYNYMRSRDKSHFEQFCQYHEAFYKYVEATSVTPFAERARDRALQTLYIILVRYYIDELSTNNAAGKYNTNIPGLKGIKEYILGYVNQVDPDEYENVEEELADIESEWEELALSSPNMTYKKMPFQKEAALFKDDYEESSRFRVMNSMRSVEPPVQVIVRE